MEGDAYIKEDEPDTVVLPCPDDYMSLPKKTYACFKYALETYDFKYLLKCDDDTYVVPDRLLSLSGDKQCVSNSWCNRLSGGAGYILSRDNVQRVVNEYSMSPPRNWAEDMMVEEILFNRFNTPFRQLKDLWYDCGGEWPCKSNTKITMHYAGRLEMEGADHLLYGPVITTCDVMKEGTRKEFKCYFYKSETIGGVRFIINGTNYRGGCHMEEDGALILDWEYKTREEDENGKKRLVRKVVTFRLVSIGGGFYEDDKYGPLSIVTPLDGKLLAQNCLRPKQESDTLKP